MHATSNNTFNLKSKKSKKSDAESSVVVIKKTSLERLVYTVWICLKAVILEKHITRGMNE